jgi:RNA polymerase primary sigma factor
MVWYLLVISGNVNILKGGSDLSVDKSYRELLSNTDRTPMVIYLEEINRIPLLKREEEIHLAKKVKKGSKDAKEKLIKSNLRFVVNVAKKYQNQGLSLEDLINEGNLGLITAVDKYDVDRGFHFISYAVWWIKQSILKALSEKSRMIRLPLNRANELLQIEKAKREIERNKEGEAEIEEIADFVAMEKERVTDVINASRTIASLESPLSSDSDANSMSELMEDSDNVGPEQTMINRALQESIGEALSTLDEREAEIIRYRFGLAGVQRLSLKEIGDRYKLTKERIRQIEKRALSRLQHPSRSQKLESYVTG